MNSTAEVMESLPGRRTDAPAAGSAAAGPAPWFGTIAIACGLSATPLLIAVAFWAQMHGSEPILSPGERSAATAARIEHARLRLKPI